MNQTKIVHAKNIMGTSDKKLLVCFFFSKKLIIELQLLGYQHQKVINVSYLIKFFSANALQNIFK